MSARPALDTWPEEMLPELDSGVHATVDRPFVLRSIVKGDVPYIVSTWAQSVAPPEGMPRKLGGEWKSNLRRIANHHIGSARVVVACDREHESTIYGWACGARGVLFWAFVSFRLRGEGIGRALIEEVMR